MIVTHVQDSPVVRLNGFTLKGVMIAPRYSGREKWMRVTLPSSWSTFGSGKGYSLLWPQGEEIKRFDWQPGAIVVPPDFWFHRHFNAGNMPARYLALRAAGKKFKGLRKLCGVNEDVKKGGSQMEYEDEDPRIHKEFEAGSPESAPSVPWARCIRAARRRPRRRETRNEPQARKEHIESLRSMWSNWVGNCRLSSGGS